MRPERVVATLQMLLDDRLQHLPVELTAGLQLRQNCDNRRTVFQHLFYVNGPQQKVQGERFGRRLRRRRTRRSTAQLFLVLERVVGSCGGLGEVAKEAVGLGSLASGTSTHPAKSDQLKLWTNPLSSLLPGQLGRPLDLPLLLLLCLDLLHQL